MKVTRKDCIGELEEIIECLDGLSTAMLWDGVNDTHVWSIDGAIVELSNLVAGLKGTR
jgi:hypothetical protein